MIKILGLRSTSTEAWHGPHASVIGRVIVLTRGLLHLPEM